MPNSANLSAKQHPREGYIGGKSHQHPNSRGSSSTSSGNIISIISTDHSNNTTATAVNCPAVYYVWFHSLASISSRSTRELMLSFITIIFFSTPQFAAFSAAGVADVAVAVDVCLSASFVVFSIYIHLLSRSFPLFLAFPSYSFVYGVLYLFF